MGLGWKCPSTTTKDGARDEESLESGSLRGIVRREV